MQQIKRRERHEIIIEKPSTAPQIISHTIEKPVRQKFKLRTDLEKLHGIKSGRHLVIFAAGPSAKRAPIDKLAKLDVDFAVINRPVNGITPNFFCAYDSVVIHDNIEYLKSFTGVIIGGTQVHFPGKEIWTFDNVGHNTFCLLASNGVCLGKSTTYAALQIFLFLGYEKICVYGLDMTADKSGELYHNSRGNKFVPYDERLKRFQNSELKYYDNLPKLPEHLRERFYFVSDINPWPFFEQMPHSRDMNTVPKILCE